MPKRNQNYIQFEDGELEFGDDHDFLADEWANNLQSKDQQYAADKPNEETVLDALYGGGWFAPKAVFGPAELEEVKSILIKLRGQGFVESKARKLKADIGSFNIFRITSSGAELVLYRRKSGIHSPNTQQGSGE